MTKRIELTEEQKIFVIESYVNGKTLTMIKRDLGIKSNGCLKRCLSEAGIHIRNKSEATSNQIRRQKEDGTFKSIRDKANKSAKVTWQTKYTAEERSALAKDKWDNMSDESRKRHSINASTGVKRYYSNLDEETRSTRTSKASNNLKRWRETATDEDKKLAHEKGFITKKLNGSLNTSKPEIAFYELLVGRYGEDDIIREYKESRYPYRCDFYIKSKDLFIELQGHQSHGIKPFDITDVECQELLHKWETRNYTGYISVWTDLDVRKMSHAKKHNLHFLWVYPTLTISNQAFSPVKKAQRLSKTLFSKKDRKKEVSRVGIK